MDEPQLVRELVAVFPGDLLVRPALARALLDQPLEILVGADARRQGKRRERGGELLHAERAPLGDGERVANALWRVLPAPSHLRGALEVPFRVGTQPRAHLVQRLPMLEAREHVVDDAIAGARVMHVVRDDPGNVERARDVPKLRRRLALFGEPMVPALDGDAPVEDVEQGSGGIARAVNVSDGGERRHPAARTTGEREQPAAVTGECIEIDAWLAARSLHARERHERGEIAVAFARLGEQDEVMEILGRGRERLDRDRQLRADDRADADLAGCLREAHRATQLVMVGERERGIAQLRRACDEHFGERGTVEQRERRVAVELHVVADNARLSHTTLAPTIPRHRGTP